MKKLILFLTTVLIFLSFSSTDPAYAKKVDRHNNYQYTWTRQKFRIDKSQILKCGKYRVPVTPITKGMGAATDYKKKTAILTIETDTVKIVIDFNKNTVTVNGTVDYNSGIFTAKSNKRMKVLMQYIANALGGCVTVGDDWIVVDTPKLNAPTGIKITPIGSAAVPNTLNSTTVLMTATANIKAGQATGGRAELYVANRLVAIDNSISANDTSVAFTTGDNSPTNAKLQAIVPSGGIVTVKLYNTKNESVTSSVGNPTLVTDYVVPTISGISSAVFNTSGQLNLNVTGAGAVGDIVDVTKLTLYDYNLGKAYQLTNQAKIGSAGAVKSDSLITITLGTADKAGLSGFGTGTMLLTVASGSFLKDKAGNTSVNFTANQTVSVNVPSLPTGLDAPTKVAVTPVGPAVLPNTLNTTTLYMTATANIKAGQATGGRAELYVGNKLVAFDNTITANDTTVTFTTSDNSPTNQKLQMLVPSGGIVSVKLYNSGNLSVTSSISNPTLTVDYSAPTLTAITSVVYNYSSNQIYLIVTGAGAVGDKVDVTKLTFYDAYLGKTYTLTDTPNIGSTGVVENSGSIIINVGWADRAGLSDFGTTSVFLTVASGSLLKDTAGNTSPSAAAGQIYAVDVIK